MAAGIASTTVEAIPAAITPLPSVQRNRWIAKAVPLLGVQGAKPPGGVQGEALGRPVAWAAPHGAWIDRIAPQGETRP